VLADATPASPDAGSSLTAPRLTFSSAGIRLGVAPSYVEATASSGAVKVIVPPGSHYRMPGWDGAGSSHLNPAVVDDRSANLIVAHSRVGTTYVDYQDE